MISRVADHCFWFGRYLERIESTARVVNVTATIALDGDLPPRDSWRAVLIVSGQEDDFLSRFGPGASGDGTLVQRYMTWDETNPTSVLQSLTCARENARSIREVISLEVWKVVNELYVWLGTNEALTAYASNRDGFYEHVRRFTQLALGLMRSTMLHDVPLNFIWLGMLTERTDQTARLLDVPHHVLPEESAHLVVETSLWLSLLRACSGFEPFFKRYRGRTHGDLVAAFLMLEPNFPRSLRYCVRSAYERLCVIRPPDESSAPGGASLARLGALDTWLSALTAASLAEEGRVHELLTHVIEEIEATCDEIGRELLL